MTGSLRLFLAASSLLAACASPYYKAPPPPMPPSKWCDGAYDRTRGTNFGPCKGHGPGYGDVQAPGTGSPGDAVK